MRSFPNFGLRKVLIIQVAPTGLHRVVTAGRLLCLENDNAFDVGPRAMHLLWCGAAVSNGGGYSIYPTAHAFVGASLHSKQHFKGSGFRRCKYTLWTAHF